VDAPDANDVFLKPTALCDSRRPLIARTAKQLAVGCRSTPELAVAIYHFVREEIVYEFRRSDLTASQVLADGVGQCFNKANLQVALARAAGLQAGFALFEIDREVYRPVVTESFYARISPRTWHCAGAFWLDGRWLTADATLDPLTLLLCLGERNQPTPRRWDGRRSVKLPEKFIRREWPTRASIDDVAPIPPRGVSRQAQAAQNRRIRRLRAALLERLSSAGSNRKPRHP